MRKAETNYLELAVARESATITCLSRASKVGREVGSFKMETGRLRVSPDRGCWPGELETADQKQGCHGIREGACLELEYELELGTKIRETINC